ncbi:MAG TPA: hypothetical protein VN154_12185 [Rhizomicrobium sp.]|nr:hypothetical protein [Rhizomicrobium sp.]
MSRFFCIGAVLLLNACAVCPQNEHVQQCPELMAWSLPEQAELSREYDALKPGALLRKAFQDYLAMRDEARACAAGKALRDFSIA